MSATTQWVRPHTAVVGPARDAVDLLAPGAPADVLHLRDRGALAHRQVRSTLVREILRSATPARTDRLFPGTDGASLGTGAAGVLWALAEIGVDVPERLVDWLVARADELTGPGLFDGASGAALALDRLGRHDDAARLWRWVDEAPLGRLDVSVSSGLAGLGLALLERAPIGDEDALMARLTQIAGELIVRLGACEHGSGLLEGGAGAALFLIHLYEITEDESLLGPAEAALLQDLGKLGWAPLSGDGAAPLWWQQPTLGQGSAGLAMVIREAMAHLDDRWLGDAAEWIATAAECYSPEEAGLDGGAAGVAMALWHLRRTPWDTPVQRRAVMGPHLGRLGLLGGKVDVRRTGAGLRSGAAGTLLALEALMGAGDGRIFLFS
jgi:hypothetical protein